MQQPLLKPCAGTHSQTLLPMVEEIVNMVGIELKELDAIAVSAGPGSFTGLRIGSATAKGLGLALNKPIVPVPTTQGIAANLYGAEGIICPLMDARRNQVYTGLYRYNKNGFEIIEDQMAVLVDEIIEKVNAFGEPVTYLGDGVDAFAEILAEKTTVRLCMPISREQEQWQQELWNYFRRGCLKRQQSMSRSIFACLRLNGN